MTAPRVARNLVFRALTALAGVATIVASFHLHEGGFALTSAAPLDQLHGAGVCGFRSAKVTTGGCGWVSTTITQDEAYAYDGLGRDSMALRLTAYLPSIFASPAGSPRKSNTAPHPRQTVHATRPPRLITRFKVDASSSVNASPSSPPLARSVEPHFSQHVSLMG